MKPALNPLVVLALLAGCTVTDAVQSVAEDPLGEQSLPPSDPWAGTASSAQDWDATWNSQPVPVWNRDGAPVGVVGPIETDALATPMSTGNDEPQRGFPQDSGSRFLLLERYNEVCDQRDLLDLELSALHAEHDAALDQIDLLQAEMTRLRGELVKEQGKTKSAEARLTEMADRLVASEIRRLEAEKQWYEAEIRARGATPVTQTSAPDGR